MFKNLTQEDIQKFQYQMRDSSDQDSPNGGNLTDQGENDDPEDEADTPEETTDDPTDYQS